MILSIQPFVYNSSSQVMVSFDNAVSMGALPALALLLGHLLIYIFFEQL
jgi:hypothetical protein